MEKWKKKVPQSRVISRPTCRQRQSPRCHRQRNETRTSAGRCHLGVPRTTKRRAWRCPRDIHRGAPQKRARERYRVARGLGDARVGRARAASGRARERENGTAAEIEKKSQMGKPKRARTLPSFCKPSRKSLCSSSVHGTPGCGEEGIAVSACVSGDTALALARSVAFRARASRGKRVGRSGAKEKAHAPFFLSRVGAAAESDMCPSCAGAGLGSAFSLGCISSMIVL